MFNEIFNKLFKRKEDTSTTNKNLYSVEFDASRSIPGDEQLVFMPKDSEIRNVKEVSKKIIITYWNEDNSLGMVLRKFKWVGYSLTPDRKNYWGLTLRGSAFVLSGLFLILTWRKDSCMALIDLGEEPIKGFNQVPTHDS